MTAYRKIRDINLVPSSHSNGLLNGQILSFALSYGRYIIIVTQMVVLSVFFMRFKLDRDHNDFKEKVSQRQAIVQSMGNIEKDIRRIQSKLTLINKITSGQTLPSDLLKFISSHSPSGIHLSSFSYDGTSVTLKGSAADLKTFNIFLQSLQSEDKINNFNIDNITKNPNNFIQFEIKGIVNSSKFS